MACYEVSLYFVSAPFCGTGTDKLRRSVILTASTLCRRSYLISPIDNKYSSSRVHLWCWIGLEPMWNKGNRPTRRQKPWRTWEPPWGPHQCRHGTDPYSEGIHNCNSIQYKHNTSTTVVVLYYFHSYIDSPHSTLF